MEKNCVGIYKIENLCNNKKYIGQSTNVWKRLSVHRSSLRGGYHENEHLQRAFFKYGEENFSFDVIKITKIKYLDRLEKLYIRLNKTMDDSYGYNMETGGNLNKIMSKKSRIKMSNFHKGKKLSEDHKNKISLAFKGEKHPLYGKKGSEAPFWGKKHTIETKRKISQSHKGENHYLYGKNMPKEQKEKISKSLIGRIPNKKAISKSKTKTGFYRLGIRKTNKVENGFYWEYAYYENNKRKFLSSVNFFDLEKKIKKKGLELIVIDDEKASETLKLAKQYKKQPKKINPKTHSGYYRVCKVKNSQYKQGFIWKYNYRENEKNKGIYSVDIEKLKNKVIEKGLKWEEYAKESKSN